jgi:hypothetical protein
MTIVNCPGDITGPIITPTVACTCRITHTHNGYQLTTCNWSPNTCTPLTGTIGHSIQRYRSNICTRHPPVTLRAHSEPDCHRRRTCMPTAQQKHDLMQQIPVGLHFLALNSIHKHTLYTYMYSAPPHCQTNTNKYSFPTPFLSQKPPIITHKQNLLYYHSQPKHHVLSPTQKNTQVYTKIITQTNYSFFIIIY